MATKERITPPSQKELHDASKQTRKGHPSGGRVLVEKQIAKRQGAKRSPKS